ncbi:MAG: O-acetyl-ADP-ribose deacetylase [Thermoguttaceae bacterium]|nr:O-acetyl-ADP-ribose deacetylase [Thermoguttaceae bacterium]
MHIVTTVVETRLGDITKIGDVDAIVNAANKTLLGGGGVDGAIPRAAGRELLEECRTLGGCETGEAKITGAYRLPCRYVIHTPGPVWRGGSRGEPEKLADCYKNSLRRAMENGVRRIAFPSISTGVYSYPVRQAAEAAAGAVKEFIQENPEALDLVVWVLFDQATKRVYDEVLEKLDLELNGPPEY